jgi:hypothetical protein
VGVHFLHVIALVREPARQDVKEHAAERINVCPSIAALPSDLLGSHIIDRADPLPGMGRPGLRAELLGQSEIGQVDVRVGLIPCKQDVRRLYIAMNQSLGMCRVKSAGNLGND